MFILIWLTFGTMALAAASATCWTAAGQVAPNDEPCYAEDPKHSVCCPAGAVCSANKLCILPYGGQAYRGSCTDRTWGRECPHFCLSEHTGDDGLTGVNMTLCRTNLSSTTYCCNDWTGRRCDCSNTNTPKVTLELFRPMATLATENSATAESAKDKFIYYDIPWNTVRPILVTVMSLCIFSMLVYLARMTYIAKRKKDPKRNDSFVEHGRRFSDFFWNTSLDEKGRADSNFSIGTIDTETDDQDREMSTNSVRLSVGRRSKSEGDRKAAPDAAMPPPIFRNDIFTKRPSRPTLPGAASKSLPKLMERPPFKRQNTDFAQRTDASHNQV